jgi:hypothetical protein
MGDPSEIGGDLFGVLRAETTRDFSLTSYAVYSNCPECHAAMPPKCIGPVYFVGAQAALYSTPASATLLDAMQASCRSQVLQEYQCPRCKVTNDRHTQSVMTEPPKALVVVVERNSSSGCGVRRMGKVTPPPVLDIATLLWPRVFESGVPVPVLFRLVALAYHTSFTGGVNSGHHTAAICVESLSGRPVGEATGSQWCRYDDRQVYAGANNPGGCPSSSVEMCGYVAEDPELVDRLAARGRALAGVPDAFASTAFGAPALPAVVTVAPQQLQAARPAVVHTQVSEAARGGGGRQW